MRWKHENLPKTTMLERKRARNDQSMKHFRNDQSMKHFRNDQSMKHFKTSQEQFPTFQAPKQNCLHSSVLTSNLGFVFECLEQISNKSFSKRRLALLEKHSCNGRIKQQIFPQRRHALKDEPPIGKLLHSRPN